MIYLPPLVLFFLEKTHQTKTSANNKQLQKVNRSGAMDGARAYLTVQPTEAPLVSYHIPRSLQEVWSEKAFLQGLLVFLLHPGPSSITTNMLRHSIQKPAYELMTVGIQAWLLGLENRFSFVCVWVEGGEGGKKCCWTINK